jgi:hypothetical protein
MTPPPTRQWKRMDLRDKPLMNFIVGDGKFKDDFFGNFRMESLNDLSKG